MCVLYPEGTKGNMRADREEEGIKELAHTSSSLPESFKNRIEKAIVKAVRRGKDTTVNTTECELFRCASVRAFPKGCVQVILYGRV